MININTSIIVPNKGHEPLQFRGVDVNGLFQHRHLFFFSIKLYTEREEDYNRASHCVRTHKKHHIFYK